MDASTIEMLQSSLRRVLVEEPESPLEARLDVLGWDEVLAEDAPTALRLLFETMGVVLSAADALGPMLARAIAVHTGRPELQTATVLLPSSLHPDRLSTTASGNHLRVDGVACSSPPADATFVVPVSAHGGPRLAVLHLGTRWTGSPYAGMDPSLDLTRVTAECEEAVADWIGDSQAQEAWRAATVSARWALAAELVAIGEHVVADAVDYTAQRKQFGRAIGTFQALQHRLAGAHASVVGARDVVIESSRSGQDWDALVAKAVAGRAAENSCTQAQQAYGAIGFTWEHGFHRYLRRVYILDRLFGDWRTLEAEIGSALIASGSVPKVGTL
jgi:Acyl-CoA dehydrogenase, C-terminal domain